MKFARAYRDNVKLKCDPYWSGLSGRLVRVPHKIITYADEAFKIRDARKTRLSQSVRDAVRHHMDKW